MPADLYHLTSEQFKQLQDALVAAFPRRIDLSLLVRYALDKNLEEIAAGETTTLTVFEVLNWAVAKGRMMDLLTCAQRENPRNPELQSCLESFGLVGPAGQYPALGVPGQGKTGMLVDLSHDQSEWDYGAPSIFRVAGGALDAFVAPHLDLSSFEMKEVRDRRQLNATEMKAWQGLVLGIPNHVRMEDVTRYDIVQWVRNGGRLVLLGFELGERHHETNFNELADLFGLRFNSNIVAPQNWTGTGKPYDEPIAFTEIQSTHPVMAGVQSLCFWNLCALTPEPGADPVLTLGENGIASLQRQGVNYTSKGWLRGGKQVFDTRYGVDWVPVMAEAPRGLTGQGRVLAIGTWVLFQHDSAGMTGFDNARLIANLLAWCTAR